MEDKNSGNKNFISVLTQYGVYFILGACIVAVAVAAILLVPSNADEKPKTVLEDSSTTEQSAAIATSKRTDESLGDMLDPLTGQPMDKTAGKMPADFTATPKSTTAPVANAELLNAPVQGEIIWKYAMEELIYSKTLDQWTTHSGVDIACKRGDSIRSVADGIIESVYTDDAFGITVIVKHKTGHKTVYSNLADENLPAVGSAVAANDVIGICGNTSSFECADKSHLHFEYHIDGAPVDPAKYVRLQSSE